MSNFWQGFEKQAMLGMALNAAKAVGDAIIRNPMKTLGIGLTALELGTGAKNGAETAAKGRNLGTFNVAQQAQY